MKDLIKINYDDYYRFLVSAGITAIIFFLAITAYFFYNKLLTSILAIIFFILILISFAPVIIGLRSWNDRQKKQDKLLDLEVRKFGLDIQEKELMIRKLKLSIEQEELADKKTKLSLKNFSVENISGRVN